MPSRISKPKSVPVRRLADEERKVVPKKVPGVHV